MVSNFIKLLFIFGFKQAYACLYGGLLLFIILGTKYYYPFEALHRYDFIFLCAVFIQILLLVFKLETLREAGVILIFHLVATVMELFKTSEAIGSWHYPEAYIFGLATVPLFTGFLYSAVGSYIVRAWHIMEFEFSSFPNKFVLLGLASLVYINFFTHHYIPDFRWVLIGLIFLLFGKSKIYFKVNRRFFHMPIIVAQILFSFFIWIAENMGTFANAWVYPSQTAGWKMVPIGNFTSWFLLALLSFALVSLVQKPKIHSKTPLLGATFKRTSS